MRIRKVALTLLCALSCFKCATGQSLRPVIDLGWLRAVQQQDGWTVDRSIFLPLSGEKIVPGDLIQAVDSERTNTCDPLSASRIFSGIPLHVATVTVIRDGTLKTLHLFPLHEPLLKLAPRYYSKFEPCFKDHAAPRLTLPDASGQLQTVRYGPKWTLLHIWSTFCPACWADIDALNEISMPPLSNLSVVALTINDDGKTITAFSQQHPIEFENLLGGTCDDFQGTCEGAAESLALPELPTDLLVDPRGEVVFVGAGSDSLHSALQMMKELFPRYEGGHYAEPER